MDARAKVIAAAQATGELPHIEMRKKLVKQQHPASSGSAAAVRHAASARPLSDVWTGASGCVDANMWRDMAQTQSAWQMSHDACMMRARRYRAFGDSSASADAPMLG